MCGKRLLAVCGITPSGLPMLLPLHLLLLLNSWMLSCLRLILPMTRACVCLFLDTVLCVLMNTDCTLQRKPTPHDHPAMHTTPTCLQCTCDLNVRAAQ